MLTLRNPATGELLHEIEDASPEEVRAAFDAAEGAQPAWRAVPLAERIEILRRFAALLEENVSELALTLTREMGKPVGQARREIRAVGDRIAFFIDEVTAVMADEEVAAGAPGSPREVIGYEPLGVVANISAWNYPYFVGTNVIVPALLTGNAVLYKPSPLASMSGRRIGELLSEAGVPREVFAAILGSGKGAGARVLQQPVRGIFFTGSHAVGKRIAEAAGPRFIRLQLELGGKDPAYVCNDVDVEVAARSLADGAFYNTGQSCCSVERIYVHQEIYDAFVEAFVGVVREFVIGDPEDEETYIGPLAREAQIDVLSQQVSEAVDRGAKLVLGGARLDRPGFYFAPTVLTEVTHSMRVMRDESFGPIIGIQSVADDAEAARWMNDTEFGLTAAVYTPDADRARGILTDLDVGSAYWNCCDRVSPRLPWSGRRHSGIGTTLAREGIRVFLVPKAWHLAG